MSYVVIQSIKVEMDNFAPLSVETAIIVAAALATWLLRAGYCPKQKQL